MRTEVCLATVDVQGRIAFINEAGERVLGYHAGEARGVSQEESFPGLARAAARGGHGEAFARPEPVEIAARRKDGAAVGLLVRQYALRGEGPESGGAIIVFEEAGEAARVEAELRHCDRLKCLDRFAPGVLHEVRNPLAGICLNAQHVLERMGRSGPFIEEVQDILADARSIDETVRRLLDFAHPDGVEVRRARIEEVLAETLKVSRVLLRRQRVRLTADLRPLSCRVDVDASQMKQVFFNLILNACAAMPRGGELRARAALGPDSRREVRVEIEDTGCGIPEEDLVRVFDPFYTTHREGMGLGLSISRRIVEGHGGRIEARSRPGRGSTFAVVLPATEEAARERPGALEAAGASGVKGA